MSEIVNKVQESGLIAIDLADYLPSMNDFVGFDLEPTLWNGLVLKEKDFREFVKLHDWQQYQNKYVYVFCSVDAILPSWAFMLVTSKLIGIAKLVTIGSLDNAKQEAMSFQINQLKSDDFIDGKLIVKGCSDIPNPEAMMSLFLTKVQPVCSSVMFGEPCSTVPIFKRPKK